MAALLVGALIYILFRPNTYVAQMVAAAVPLYGLSYTFSWLECDLVKYYLPDYLWAVSLSCGLHGIFQPTMRGSVACTAVVALFGGVYEGLQCIGVINGTGDAVDGLWYVLAGVTVNIINGKGVIKDEKSD